MKYLLDTNVYLGACRSEETRIQFRKALFPLLPATFLIRRHKGFSLRVLHV